MVDIIYGDMYQKSLRDADVVILFLSGTANEKLSPKLKEELKEGSRIVSYYHQLPGFETKSIGESKMGDSLYLYRKGSN